MGAKTKVRPSLDFALNSLDDQDLGERCSVTR